MLVVGYVLKAAKSTIVVKWNLLRHFYCFKKKCMTKQHGPSFFIRHDSILHFVSRIKNEWYSQYEAHHISHLDLKCITLHTKQNPIKQHFERISAQSQQPSLWSINFWIRSIKMVETFSRHKTLSFSYINVKLCSFNSPTLT